MIQWNDLSKTEKLAKENDCEIKLQDMMMDISAVHLKTPLRLQDLLEDKRGNFGHDVFGIRRYVDRTTGELNDGFSPRFTKIN